MAVTHDVLLPIITAVIAAVIAPFIVKRIESFKQKRKTNEHIREEQLENLYKAFRAHSYESVTESQDSDYVIEEIKKLLELSVEYFNVCNPELRKLVPCFWKLCYKAKNYLFRVQREETPYEHWANMPFIGKLCRHIMEKPSVQIHKTCYWDLYESFSQVLEVERAVWKGFITVNDITIDEIIADYCHSRWFLAFHPYAFLQWR